MVLKVDEIHSYYGESPILHGVSLHVGKGEIVGLIGNNGVGKTTTLRSILGLTQVRAGNIFFLGKEILGLPPYRISRLGISLIPENREIFPDLTVYENLLIGTKNSRGGQKINFEKVYDFFPILKDRRGQKGGTLSGGEQQMLTIARGLVGDPELILLDEFSEGLQPSVIKHIVEILREVQKEGTSILLVEQDARLAIHLSQRIYIMEKGQISYKCTSQELMSDENIIECYMAV